MILKTAILNYTLYNQSELRRYRDIVLAALEYHLEKMAGGVKFDQFDPYGDHCLRMKRLTKKDYQHGRVERIKKRFLKLIGLPLHSGDLNFDRYIKEKTGFDIDIFGNLQERIDKILERKIIESENEYRDVSAMINLYHQTAVWMEG